MRNQIMNIPFPKLKLDKTKIEFQVIDMSTLLEIKTDHNLEYPHRLEFNLIMIVVDGKGIHHIDFKAYDYDKGSIFFIKKHQAHSFKINSNLNCYLLQFTDNFLNRLVKNSVYDIFDYMRYPVNMQLDEDDLKDILNNITLLKNQLKFIDDDFKEPILQSLLQSLLLQLKRKREKQTVNLNHKDQKIYNEFLHLVHASHKYTNKVEYYS